jgi:hypothetical protein
MVEALVWISALCGFIVGALTTIITLTIYISRRSGRDKN